MAEECHKELVETVARKEWDIAVMTGKANLEVRPKSINKGTIAARLIDQYPSKHSGTQEREAPHNEALTFALCLGDDHTDEDMFRALNSSALPEEGRFSVVVSKAQKPTLAKWRIKTPEDVVDALGRLNGLPKSSAGP